MKKYDGYKNVVYLFKITAFTENNKIIFFFKNDCFGSKGCKGAAHAKKKFS